MQVILDSNVFDLLAADPEFVETVTAAVRMGQIRIVVTPRLWTEVPERLRLEFGRRLSISYINEGVATCDGPVNARLGDGRLFRAHLGKSRKLNDAYLADAADYDADVLVTEDGRLRRRLNEHALKCRGLSFSEWREVLANALPG